MRGGALLARLGFFCCCRCAHFFPLVFLSPLPCSHQSIPPPAELAGQRLVVPLAYAGQQQTCVGPPQRLRRSAPPPPMVSSPDNTDFTPMGGGRVPLQRHCRGPPYVVAGCGKGKKDDKALVASSTWRRAEAGRHTTLAIRRQSATIHLSISIHPSNPCLKKYRRACLSACSPFLLQIIRPRPLFPLD